MDSQSSKRVRRLSWRERVRLALFGWRYAKGAARQVLDFRETKGWGLERCMTRVAHEINYYGRLGLVVLVLALSAAQARGVSVVVVGDANEGSWAEAEFTFTTPGGVEQLPASYKFVVNDQETARLLVTTQTVADPAASPCDTPSTGCTKVQIPESGQDWVGRCNNVYTRSCVSDANCGVGECLKDKQALSQPHVLTLRWTSGGLDADEEIVYDVKRVRHRGEIQ